MKKFEFGNIKNLDLEITTGKDGNTLIITGIIPGGSVDTEFETRVSPDGEIETRHCGIGPGYIWTEWQEGYIRGE